VIENHRILIVEDDVDVSKMLSDYFEAQGYKVMATAWGEDALEMAEETLPDLVVLDIRLPDIDGFEVCRRLRSQRRTEAVPIIFLTERGERVDRLTGLELGAVDYITKPFDIQELRLRVRNALLRSKLGTMINPVTGLPTDPIVNHRLSGLLQEGKWALLSVGIHGLQEFSDRYGFVAGDDLLRAVALIIKNAAKEMGEEDPFIGHLSQTDLILVGDPSKIEKLRERVATRLEEAINYFYPLQDRPDKGSRVSWAMNVLRAEDRPFESALELKRAALQE